MHHILSAIVPKEAEDALGSHHRGRHHRGASALIVIGIYNGLVQRRLRVDEALGQIEVQLERRWT